MLRPVLSGGGSSGGAPCTWTDGWFRSSIDSPLLTQRSSAISVRPAQCRRAAGGVDRAFGQRRASARLHRCLIVTSDAPARRAAPPRPQDDRAGGRRIVGGGQPEGLAAAWLHRPGGQRQRRRAGGAEQAPGLPPLPPPAAACRRLLDSRPPPCCRPLAQGSGSRSATSTPSLASLSQQSSLSLDWQVGRWGQQMGSAGCWVLPCRAAACIARNKHTPLPPTRCYPPSRSQQPSASVTPRPSMGASCRRRARRWVLGRRAAARFLLMPPRGAAILPVDVQLERKSFGPHAICR